MKLLIVSCWSALLLVSSISARKVEYTVKDKREAPGSYNGPSYKYLPPSSVSLGSNEYQGGYSGSSGISFGHGDESDIGNGFVETVVVQSKGGPLGGSLGGAGGFKLHGGSGIGHNLHTVAIPSSNYGAPGLSYNHNQLHHGHSPSLGSSHSYSSGGGHSISSAYLPPAASYGLPSLGHLNGLAGGKFASGVSSVDFGLGAGALGSSHYSSKYPSIPSTTYGVPFAPPLNSYSIKHTGNSFGSGISLASSGAPAYAAGHKGLGHFSFALNKPSTLHTSVVPSNGHGIGGGHHNAPFKPSAFLGSSHSSGSSYPSSEYLPPSRQYLAPAQSYHSSSSESVYNSPSVIYGAPAHGSHGIIDQGAYDSPAYSGADDHYSVPHQTYGVPSGPGKAYLPPSSSYLPPSHH